MSIELSEALAERLSQLPQSGQAVALLSREGPLVDSGLAFTPEQAGTAYLIWRAYSLARMDRGMLSGRPGYEADGTLQARCHATAMRCDSLAEFGVELFRSLGLTIERALRVEDVRWWRVFREAYADSWRTTRTRPGMTEVLFAVKECSEMMFAMRDHKKARTRRDVVTGQEKETR